MNQKLLNKTLESIQRGETDPELIHSMFKLMSKQPPKVVKKLDQDQLDFLAGIEKDLPELDYDTDRKLLESLECLDRINWCAINRNNREFCKIPEIRAEYIEPCEKELKYKIALKKTKSRTQEMIQEFLN